MAVGLARNVGPAARMAAVLPGLGFSGAWRWRAQRALHWWLTALGVSRAEPVPSTRPAHALADGHALAFTLSLPVDALASIEDLLALEVERRSPFDADGVEILYRLTAGTTANEVGVRAAMAPADRLPGPGKTYALADDQGRYLDGRTGPAGTRGWLPVAACLGLLAIALALPFVLLDRQEAAIADRIVAVSGDAQAAMALRRDSARLAEADRLALAAKGTATDSLAVLAALTAHVPDTAYLTAIRLDGAAVRIEGEARDAAGLLANLAGAAPFRDVRFASPVTVDGETGTERVQIALTLAGGDTP